MSELKTLVNKRGKIISVLKTGRSIPRISEINLLYKLVLNIQLFPFVYYSILITLNHRLGQEIVQNTKRSYVPFWKFTLIIKRTQILTSV